jgi:hypothetical protein
VLQCDENNDLITDGLQANTMVLVYTNTAESCSNTTEVRTLSQMDHKPIQRCECTPQMVMTTTITADSLLSRPKLDYDGGYDVVVKGVSVEVFTYALDLLSW